MNNKIKLEGFPLLIEKDKAEQILKIYDAIYFLSGQLEQFRNDDYLYKAEAYLNGAIMRIGDYLVDHNVYEYDTKNKLDGKFTSIADYFDRFGSNAEELRIKKREANQ